MDYTIGELSRLSGVTPRTLRWYDRIGLLAPKSTAANGYRVYGPEQVDRLQDILYYRALGVKLSGIKAALDDPAFDRLTALRCHLRALQAQQERLNRLIRSVQATIATQEQEEIMNDEQKFEAFKRSAVARNEEAHGAEIRERYGDAAMDEANAVVMGMTRAQYAQWQELGRAILAQLEQAVTAGEDPAGPCGREIARAHRQWLAHSGRCDAAKHRGLAQLYVLDERFTAYYDRNLPGCARFLCDAVQRWADAL